MNRLAFGLSLLLAFCSIGRAQTTHLVPSTTASIALPTSTQARTVLVAGSPGKSIYLTALHLVGGASSVVTWSEGTGTNCATGTVVLNAPETLTAGSITDFGDGAGAIMVVPIGADLCLTVGTAAVSGWVAYAQQ